MYEEELAGKIRAHEAEQTRQQEIGSIGCNAMQQPSLEERIRSQLHYARSQGRKAARLEELALLLAKHPDVARILDLLEETRS